MLYTNFTRPDSAKNTQHQIGASNMKKFAAVAGAAFAFVTIVLLTTLILAETRSSALDSSEINRPLPVHLEDPMPAGASCNWQDLHRYGESLGCTIGDNRDFWFSYDVNRQIVIYLSYSVHNSSVGQFVIAWGNPASYNGSYQSRYIYWNDGRFVYTADENGISPYSKVYFAGVYPVTGARAWRGFNN